MEVDLVALREDCLIAEHGKAGLGPSKSTPTGRVANTATRTLQQRALSRRQLQVLALLGEGVPARTIAGQLGLAESTVRNHIRLVLVKLGCHSQLEAVADGRRRGLI